MTAGLGSVWFKKSFMENRGISYVLSPIMDKRALVAFFGGSCLDLKALSSVPCAANSKELSKRTSGW